MEVDKLKEFLCRNKKDSERGAEREKNEKHSVEHSEKIFF